MSVKKRTINNEEIYNRIENGETQKSISNEIGVSPIRISQIYNRQKRLYSRPNDDLYALCLLYSGSINMATMVYNGLRRGCKIYGVLPISTVEELKYIPINSVHRIRNIGEKSVTVIEDMINSLK